MTSPVQIEAPSTQSAMALVGELARFGAADLVPIDGGRWQVSVADPAADTLAELLTTLDRWVAVWRLGCARVVIDGLPHTLSCGDQRSEPA